MLDCARKNADACNVSVDFRLGDAECLPFADNSFDAVVNRWVLWTVQNPKVALSEWTRVLKPGGRLLIFDGNWYSGRKTMVQEVWKQFTRFYMLLSERRNMWKRERESTFVESLWSTHANRPEDDRILFMNAGLINVEFSLDLNKKVYTFSDYLRQGYWGDTFIVTGVKPIGSDA
jgi:ubiquinone/menaquinone biosynthesis C-methylase UbiE